MKAQEKSTQSPAGFALTWVGASFLGVTVLGIVAGLLRGDLAGTIGTVVLWGMLAAAVAVGCAGAWRER